MGQITGKDFDSIVNELDRFSKDKKKLSFLIPLLWEYDNNKFYPYLLKLSSLNSRQVREAIVSCLKGYQNGFDDFKSMIKSKKQAERIIAIELLASLNKPEVVIPLLNELLLKEKVQKVKNAVSKYFAIIKQNEAQKRKDIVLGFGIEDFNNEAEQNKDLNLENINKINWLKIDELPKLNFKKNNEKISQNLLYSLLNSLTKSKEQKLFYEAKKLLSFIKKEDIIKFSKSIYDMWKNSREKANWVLILLSVYCSDDSVLDELFDKLIIAIENNDNSLKKLLASNIILMGKKNGLKKMARLLNNKFDSLISNLYYDIGAKLNLGNLLYDYRMKTFAFDSKAKKTIDYGARSFAVTLTSDFKFTVVGNNGKSYKNLPRPSKKDDPVIANKAYEDFKNMKKELKDYIKDRKIFLQRKMIDSTLWDLEDYLFIFMENPIMNNLSKGLIWLADGKTFRIMEDNTLVDIEDEEFEISKDSKISLIHPVDMLEEDILAWKEQLEDYEITQAFEQLNRIVFTPSEKQLDDNIIDEFKGYMVMRISFKSKLMDKFGWKRGPAKDAGCYYSYNKYIGNIKAELEFMGECYGVYGDRFQEIWMGTLYFYDLNGKEVKLKDIPKRQLSEIYLEIKTLADSGSGYNEDYLETGW